MFHLTQWFPKRNSQGTRGYVPVMTALKFTKFLIKGIMFAKNNRGTSLIGDVFILYKR